MVKSNFLLVDLNESKTKKLAETITSDKSRKILNYLTEKDDTEQNIAQNLSIPISTVHYHLQKLLEAQLVIVEEFHYSEKGREVNHYKLANKYIIIAPKKVSGLKQKLRGILPVAVATLGITGVIKVITNNQIVSFGTFAAQAPLNDVAMERAPLLAKAVPKVADQTNQLISSQPDIATWFLIGGFTVLILYALVEIIKQKFHK